MDNHNGEEEIARVLTEMPKPPLKQRALRVIAGIGSAIAFLGGLWLLCSSSAAKEITAFIAGGNGYVAGFLVLIGLGCAIMTAGAAKKGRVQLTHFCPIRLCGVRYWRITGWQHGSYLYNYRIRHWDAVGYK